MEAPVDVVPSVEETSIDKHDDNSTKAALTPPTSEDMDKQAERLSSELSDLESEDDGEEIEPDHYYEGGKIPVFKPVSGPTWEMSRCFADLAITSLPCIIEKAQTQLRGSRYGDLYITFQSEAASHSRTARMHRDSPCADHFVDHGSIPKLQKVH
jgi:hypothetical protein